MGREGSAEESGGSVQEPHCRDQLQTRVHSLRYCIPCRQCGCRYADAENKKEREIALVLGLFENTECVQVRKHGREKGLLFLQVVLHHLNVLPLIIPSCTYRLPQLTEPFRKQPDQRLIASVCLFSNRLDFLHFLFIPRYPLLQDPLQQNTFRMEPHHLICATCHCV